MRSKEIFLDTLEFSVDTKGFQYFTTEEVDLNATLLQRYSTEPELKQKLEEIRNTRSMFLKNCTQNMLEIDSVYGTIRIKPNQYAKFEPKNQSHCAKLFVKTPSELKEMNIAVMNDIHMESSTSDRKWFTEAEP